MEIRVFIRATRVVNGLQLHLDDTFCMKKRFLGNEPDGFFLYRILYN